MDQIAPEVYGSLNYAPRKFALQSFDLISKDNKVKDIIVDIGAGDGGVTRELASRVQHQRIVAIDVEPEMTAYAQRTNSGPTIEYKTQDMSVAWDQLDPDIQRLESKVGLIFSNFVLHYIQNKRQLLSTFKQLLSPNGSIHANIIILADLNAKLEPSDQKEWFLSADQQINSWKQALADNDLIAESFDIIEDMWPLSRHQIIDFLPVLIGDYRPFFETNQQFDTETKHIGHTVFDAYTNPDTNTPKPNAWKQLLADETIKQIKLHLKILRLVAHK